MIIANFVSKCLILPKGLKENLPVEFCYYRFLYKQPQIKEGLSYIRKRYFLETPGDNLVKTYRDTFPEKVTEKIHQADVICEHIFDLLGSGPIKLSPDGLGYQKIDWHSDFKSGYRWNTKTFYKNIRYGCKEGVDIKVPWELSRFQHLTILGQAYLLTKNKKYTDEFVYEITDWIKSNQVGFGVNWFCPMDVAIRAANWLVASEYFQDSPDELDDFWNSFYSSIYEHGKFIRSHLEYSPVLNTNHYIADIAGLYFIAAYCPFFKESNAWKEFAFNELVKEMQKQVYSDGCDFEASTSYHRLVLEMFFYCEFLGKKEGMDFPNSYGERLKKMFEFSLYCIKPNGKIPQIGDNDSGRFLIFSKCPVLEHKYLLSLAAIYYRNPKYKLRDFDYDEEALWVFGLKGKEDFDSLTYRSEFLQSKAFPDAGWYIMRHNKDYCFISCGPNGQNCGGGHAHNDKLSFELMLEGEDVIVDPGTFTYTAFPRWRNKFRSTAFHNTVLIENIEQNKINTNLFALKKGVQVKSTRFDDNSKSIVFEGGIIYLFDEYKHFRKIVLNKQNHQVEVIDNIIATTDINCTTGFCLAPNSKNLKVTTQLGAFTSETDSYSAEYGGKAETIFLRNKIGKPGHFVNTMVISKI